MWNNKDAGLPDPDEETIKSLERIDDYDRLADKLEQIGCEAQMMIEGFKYPAEPSKEIKSEEESGGELYQQYGNLFSYMSYLRELTAECPSTKNPSEAERAKMNTVMLIQSFETEALFNRIWCEKADVIARILLCMESPKAAGLFGRLHLKTQVPVIEAIVKMEEITPEELAEIDAILKGKKTDCVYGNYLAKGGIAAAVEILNLTHNVIVKKVFHQLAAGNEILADEIRKEMFVFEDIVMLGNDQIAVAFNDVEDADICMALKGVDEEIADCVFRNISKERAGTIKNKMEEYGPAREKDVKNAQWKIFKHILSLKEQGKIEIV